MKDTYSRVADKLPTKSGGGSTIINITTGTGGGDTGDHLPLDGSLAMTGNLDLGNNDIANVNLLNGGDVDTLIANSHARLHSVTSTADHTITGSAFDLLGATATNTLGILTPSSAPGAASAILKSDASGFLTLPKFVASTQVTTPLIDTASGDLALTPASGTVAINDNLTAVGTVQGATVIGTTNLRSPLIDTASGNLTITPAGGTVTVNSTLSAVTSVITPLVTNSGQLIVNAGATSLKLGLASVYPVQIDGESLFINNGVPDGGAALHVKSATTSDVTAHFQKIAGQSTRIWKITDETDQELIILDEEGNLESGNPGFVSGLTGWQVTSVGNVEFNNGVFRGELHSSIFVADEFHASSGTMVFATAGRLLNSAVVASGSPVVIDIEDPPVGHARIFAVGDRLRSKAIGGINISGGSQLYMSFPGMIDHAASTNQGIHVLDIWLQVTSIADMGTYWEYTCTLLSGSDGTLTPGVGVIKWGTVGSGLILATSDLNYAPYLDVFTSGAEPWNGDITPHARFGKLSGIGVLSASHVWGFVAGTDLSDNTQPYVVASNAGVELYKVGLTLHDGTNPTVKMSASGDVKFGSDVDVLSNTGFHFDPTTGDVTIGDISGQYIKWDQAAGIMTLNGSLIAGDTPTTVSWTDIANRPADIDIYNDEVIWSQIGGIPESFTGGYRDILSLAMAPLTTISALSFVIPYGLSIVFREGTYASKTVISAKTVTMAGVGNRTYVYMKDGSVNDSAIYTTTSVSSLGLHDVLIGVGIGGAERATFAEVWGRTYIGDNSIVAGSIVTSHLTADAVTADILAANSVVTTSIVAGSIITTHLDTGVVTAEKITVDSLSALNIDTGALTITGTLTAGGGDTLITPDGIAIARSGYLLEAPEENSIHWYIDPSTKAQSTGYIWNLYDITGWNFLNVVSQNTGYWPSVLYLAAQNVSDTPTASITITADFGTDGIIDLHQGGRGYVAGALTATGYCYININGTPLKVLVST